MDESKLFNLSIYTPNDLFLSIKTSSVTVPGVAGSFQVLVNHAPIISSISNGSLKAIDDKGNTQLVAVKNGIAEFRNNNLTLNVSSAETIAE